MNELKRYYYNNVNTFNKINKNIPKWYWISLTIVGVILFILIIYVKNFSANIIISLGMGAFGGIVTTYMYYKELKVLAKSNGIKEPINRSFKEKGQILIRELRKLEIDIMKNILKNRNVDSADKKRDLLEYLNDELQMMENKKSNVSIIIAFLIPLIIDIVLTFYSLLNLPLALDEFTCTVIVSLIKYVLPIYLLLWSSKKIFEIVTQIESKKEQLKDLIYIVDEILIFG